MSVNTPSTPGAHPELSLVCRVGPRAGDLPAIHHEFRAILLETGRSAEFIYLLDGASKQTEAQVQSIQDGRFPVRLARMAKEFGEAAALRYAWAAACCSR